MSVRDSATPREFLRLADTLVDKGYRLGPKIGEGTYAKVRVCERHTDGKIMAVKIVNLKIASTDYLKKFLPRELSVIQRMNHKNIINTHEVIRNDDLLFMVTDYAERGDLLCHIRDHGPIPDDEAKRMFTQIVGAVLYLHCDMNIAHRDLKCENILIMRDRSVVLSDFGFARPLDQNDPLKGKYLSKTFCGSPSYCSPEVLRGVPYDPKMNDIWSLGVLLYVMVTSAMPFDDSNVRKMVNKQVCGEIKFPPRVESRIHPNCKRLISQMIEPHACKRPTVDCILKSEWILSNCK
ncbi:TSSK [Mytilus coruscus]|uniref:TSSK n=1 Tax=Mytilus coruscus TaxID=42192 RepID=A0A6J8F1M9_MYTCO|nr:TSSK [Mytilus coruscus]